MYNGWEGSDSRIVGWLARLWRGHKSGLDAIHCGVVYGGNVQWLGPGEMCQERRRETNQKGVGGV